MTTIKELVVVENTNTFLKESAPLPPGDLATMAPSKFMFANKFHFRQDKVVIGCLEEMLINRTREYYLGQRDFDTTVYENSDIVKDRLVDPAVNVDFYA